MEEAFIFPHHDTDYSCFSELELQSVTWVMQLVAHQTQQLPSKSRLVARRVGGPEGQCCIVPAPLGTLESTENYLTGFSLILDQNEEAKVPLSGGQHEQPKWVAMLV